MSLNSCQRPGSLLLLVAMMATLGSCSHREVYETLQRSRLHECERLPAWRQKECTSLYDTPWHLYRLEREAPAADDGDP